MDSVWTQLGAVAVALISMAGTVYVAQNSRKAAHEQAAPQMETSVRQQDRETFNAIRDALQQQINGLREEIGQLKHDVEKLRGERDDREDKLRTALSIVRTANLRLQACSCGQEPVTVPAELITWSI
jgi:TolA-binding protein